jgi:hypothetical protein
MAEAKTKATKTSLAAYLKAITDPERRRDAKALAGLMGRATGGCLHIRQLSDVDAPTLGRLLAQSAKRLET